MPYMEGLSMDDLDTKAIDVLVNLLKTQRLNNSFRPHIFSQIADEKFIRETILPLGNTTDDPLRENIRALAEAAGRRLGIRFGVPSP